MKLCERILWLVVLVELLVTGMFAGKRLARPQPPLPDLTYVDSATAEHIRQLAHKSENDMPEDWLALAKIYAIFGFFPAADLCCRRAAELDENSFEIAFWWGMALDRLGRTGEAIKRFEQAAELAVGQFDAGEDRSIICWHHVGRNYLREENVEQAEAAFRKAQALPHSRVELAKILVRSERAEEAIPMLETLVAKQPTIPNFLQLLARAREATGDRRGGLESWDRVDRANDESSVDLIAKMLSDESQGFGIHRLRFEANELVRNGDQDEAIKKAHEILEIDWQPQVASQLALAEMWRGRVGRAQSLLAQLYEREGPIPVHLDMVSIGVIYQEMGEDAKAIDMWKRTLQVAPNLAAHARLAHCYNDASDRAQMTHHLVMAQHMQAIEAFNKNDLEFAAQAFQKTLEIDVRQPQTWFYLGECFRFLGQPQKAQQAYMSCLKLNPNHGRALASQKRLGDLP